MVFLFSHYNTFYVLAFRRYLAVAMAAALALATTQMSVFPVQCTIEYTGGPMPSQERTQNQADRLYLSISMYMSVYVVVPLNENNIYNLFSIIKLQTVSAKTPDVGQRRVCVASVNSTNSWQK